MPSYLVIETTGNLPLNKGGNHLVTASSEHEAVAKLIGNSYAYTQTFCVTEIINFVNIKIEQERILRALDANDKSDTTVLGTYNEAELSVLKKEPLQTTEVNTGIKVI